MTAKLIIMLVCLVMSAYFSATETAFSTMNKTRVKAIAEKGNKRAEMTLKLADKYDKLISTILIGNNIVNILLASLGTLLFVELMGDAGATVSTAVTTLAVLAFGEITPKNLARNFPEKFAMFSAPIIRFIGWILYPVSVVFSGWNKLLSLIIRSDDDSKMSQDELLLLVDEVQQDGSIDEEEGDLLRNAIEFTDLKAEDILTHRTDIEAVPANATKDEVARAFTESRFSRLLVYEDSIDNIVGVIHQKDFYVGKGVTPKPLEEIITPPLFIHQSEMISDLLKHLQREKSHIAVVLDEYGGTLGIVTMEDILEELVGEIWDEHDEIVEEFRQVEPDRYIVDPSANFEDFCDFFELSATSDSVSLGGWIMEQLGGIPEPGDGFDFENINVTVSKTESHRISEVVVLRREKADEDGANEE